MKKTTLHMILQLLRNIKFWLFLFFFMLSMWTQIALFAVFAFYFLSSVIIQKYSCYKKLKRTFFYKVYALVKWLALIIILSVVVRTFFIEVYNIPTGSMEKSLMPGDMIIVDKLTLGMERPESILDLANVGVVISLFDGLKEFCEQHKLTPKRLPGIRKVKRNDILVFNSPKSSLILIKRIIGCAGDMVKIDKGNVWINQQLIQERATMVNEWYIYLNSNRSVFSLLDSLKIKQVATYYDFNKKMHKVAVSNKEIERIKACPDVDSVNKFCHQPQKGFRNIYPYNPELTTSVDYWGSIVIPQKGMEIQLTSENIMWYKKIICQHEHHQLDERNDSIFIDDQYKTNYVFEQDYYFAMGDSRHFSFDSRFYGFVPYDHIIGKARRILISMDANKYGWDSWRINRTFKDVN